MILTVGRKRNKLNHIVTGDRGLDFGTLVESEEGGGNISQLTVMVIKKRRGK